MGVFVGRFRYEDKRAPGYQRVAVVVVLVVEVVLVAVVGVVLVESEFSWWFCGYIVG